MTATYAMESLAEQLFEAEQWMLAQGDEETAKRLAELADRAKRADHRLRVAFCGLFSAGKSSLINALTERDERPTGAVPTTAEVAETVMRVDAATLVLMDTPGIDSTDDAHQAAMEAALHLADIVVLVMDYQHVEADENLELGRTLQERGKRLVCVVNQVDKHLDWELSFAEYQERVETTLSDYDIECEGLFYTSSRTSEHNQLALLRETLCRLANDDAAAAPESILASARDLVVQHVRGRQVDRRAALSDWMTQHLGYVPAGREEAASVYESLAAEAMQIRESIELALQEMGSTEDVVRQEFARSIELAQISPYDTTELGRRYVESLRQDFRVGWIGWKEKTEMERRNRLDAFVEDLQDRSVKFLLWPIQGELRRLLKETAWSMPEWNEDIDALRVTITPELLQKQLNRGAIGSDQYPYQFVKDVVGAVKRQAEAQVNALLDSWFEQRRSAIVEEMSAASQQSELEAKLSTLRNWRALDEEAEEMVASVLGLSMDASGVSR